VRSTGIGACLIIVFSLATFWSAGRADAKTLSPVRPPHCLPSHSLTHSPSPPPPLSLSQYRALLTEALQTLRLAQFPMGNFGRAEAFAKTAALLKSIEQVSLPDGTTLAVNNDDLLAGLADPETPVEPLIAQLAARLAAVERAEKAARLDREAGRAALQRALQDPRFQKTPSPFASLLERLQELQDRFWRLIDGLLQPIWQVAGSTPGLSILTLVALALLIGLLVFYGLGLRRSAAPEASLAEQTPLSAHLTAALAWQQALALRDSHRRESLRYLALAAILSLDERGIWPLDRSLTNHEYLHALQHDEELHNLMSPVLTAFETAWYGGQTPPPAEVTACQERVERIRGITR